MAVNKRKRKNSKKREQPRDVSRPLFQVSVALELERHATATAAQKDHAVHLTMMGTLEGKCCLPPVYRCSF